MIPYWILFGIPAFASLMEGTGRRWAMRATGPLLAVMTLVPLLIGFRYEVGGDWGAYLRRLVEARLLKFEDAMTSGDPGYILLNWLNAQIGADIWLTNFVCAILFCAGLYRFVIRMPRPWLALAVAVPYLVIVVAMGYTRQAVAIGLAMHGFVSLANRSTVRFVLWTILAATFHKSAVLLIPIAALMESKGRLWTALWVGGASIAAYYTLLQDSVDQLVYGYVDAAMESSGAAIRVAMNAAPAALFLVFRSRFLIPAHEKKIWIALSLIAIGMVPALILSPSSTAVDRIGLYLIPLQLVVLSNAPNAFSSSKDMASLLGVVVITYCAATQFMWLNFANNASYWVPYTFFPV